MQMTSRAYILDCLYALLPELIMGQFILRPEYIDIRDTDRLDRAKKNEGSNTFSD
jgi:hypothetical protein